MTMETIIVATDYSKTADNAVAYAIALAQKFQMKLILFNTYHVPFPATELPVEGDEINYLISVNQEKLEKEALEIAQKNQVVTESVASHGLMVDELKKLVVKKHADLVVMGMRGNSIDRKLFGSLTTTTLREANFPVLVIPEKAYFRRIKRILFACDFNSITLGTRLNLLRDLATGFKSSIEVLQVVKEEALVSKESYDMEDPEVSFNLENLLSHIKHTYRTIEDDNIVEGIEKGMQEYKADMLVMVPHRPSFWNMIFNPGNTRKMALRSEIPLLSLPNSSFTY